MTKRYRLAPETVIEKTIIITKNLSQRKGSEVGSRVTEPILTDSGHKTVEIEVGISSEKSA